MVRRRWCTGLSNMGLRVGRAWAANSGTSPWYTAVWSATMVMLLALGQDGGGLAGIDDGGDAELPGHRGQVTGDAADVGDQAFEAADQGGIIGRGGPGDEDGIFRQVSGGPAGGQTDGPRGNPRRGGLALGQEEGIAFRVDVDRGLVRLKLHQSQGGGFAG